MLTEVIKCILLLCGIYGTFICHAHYLPSLFYRTKFSLAVLVAVMRGPELSWMNVTTGVFPKL